ncbi:MAG: hypothetical protein HEQ35_06985 [Gloeotrichia echinulata IR180]|jgi:hypothetical protein|nr:hypothetical protein [Gloeotrichia echinulata DEX184]
MYCQQGDKPKVKYKFNDGAYKIFESKFSPIDVITRSTQATSDNYSPEGFQISFYSPNNFKILTAIVKDYRIVNKGYLEFNSIPCGGDTFTTTGPTIDPSTIVIDKSVKCPPQKSDENCIIEIKYNAQIIFSDTGKCPVSFTVACGNCPDGTVECKTNYYPVYCCLPCAETAAKINNLANNIRR